MSWSTEFKIAAGLGLGLVAAAIIVYRRGLAATAQGIGSAAVGVGGGLASGTVIGVGGLVGIPATNQTQCQQDIAAGRVWDASFSCPAKDFLKYLVS